MNLTAYRESYSTQHVLIRLLEEWTENLNNNYTVSGVLMDLSKTFACILHDLLIAKLSAYGLNGNALKYIYTYLKNRKQCVCVKTFVVTSKTKSRGFSRIQSSDQCYLMRS